ncbi:hypothetical protein [Parasporobacterium paucivorans]|uniref:Cell shape-determining protein n=1 Tax=Parasporobacterium paucivorans DSM 15970 TaxID=1122934 RepID=A0A1M6E3X4_9FIRM|nr:hypothetical protein [Parasporobacterium paucivorans]SHI80093.1 hypothetical protein SAMN02745691_00848 [Parasporobacterium paucivorans DSM 15970]
MKKRYWLSAIIVLILAAAAYYVVLPPMNIRSTATWGFVIFFVAVYAAINILWAVTVHENPQKFRRLIIGVIIAIAIFIAANIISGAFFHSETYSSQVALKQGVFQEDFPEEENISNIALMDTQSAIIIGNRTLGTLSDLVSQFKVSDNYTQINYKGSPMKVSPLNYVGFIKYLKNDGIPGYVLVDPVKNTAEFVRLDKKIQYSPSAYFFKNLDRKLRLSHPTDIFGEKHFEIDDEGNPYWICSVLKPKAGLFGAVNIETVIIMDAVTGESTKYDVDKAPTWIDYVFSGEKISQLYNWYGAYQSGYWNSIFGQEGCTATTDNFGYKTIGDDVYVFTGITSLTAQDESNVGFIMVNSRTGDFTYYPVSGAEEYSAMSAAEGEVQQYKYTASFPSVINVNGQATYLMVLKDDNSIVKLYAMVNMENYNVVATGKTQDATLSEYKKLLARSVPGEEIKEDDITTAQIIITDIQFIVNDGETFCYIKDENKNVYRTVFTENLILLNVGDTANIQYLKAEDITELISIDK